MPLPLLVQEKSRNEGYSTSERETLRTHNTPNTEPSLRQNALKRHTHASHNLAGPRQPAAGLQQGNDFGLPEPRRSRHTGQVPLLQHTPVDPVVQ